MQYNQYKSSVKASQKEKINQYSGDVKNRFIFLAPKYRSREYENAMEELTTFVYIGDNDHDDAPDGVTQLMMSITEKRLAEVSAVQNPFWGRR